MSHAWPEGFIQESQVSIAWLELYALTMAIMTWASFLTGKRVLMHCDNQSVVHMVNKQTSPASDCMFLICILVLEQMRNNFTIDTEYIRSEENEIANALSLLQLDWFWELHPSARPHPCLPPQSLCPPYTGIWNQCYY